MCTGAGRLSGHLGRSYSLEESGYSLLFEPSPACPEQSSSQSTEETHSAKSKEGREEGRRGGRERERKRGRGGGREGKSGERENNKRTYLGYFHKMAQDFCPYF